jgi:hypothetical protein
MACRSLLALFVVLSTARRLLLACGAGCRHDGL